MQRKKRVIEILLVVLLMLSRVPASVFAAECNTPKEEVVYINLNADGSVKEINVVNIFDLDQNGRIIDYGEYENLRNMTTTDNIDYKNNTVTIDTNAGKLYYEGKLKENVIPWTINIKYFMDGKEYLANQIAGMSGKFEMKMSIKQNKNCDSSFFEGYALQTSLTLDTNKATDIQADGATVANDGSDKQLTYTILPKTEKEIVVSANVKDFEMNGIAINGIRMNLDIDFDDSTLQGKIDEVIGVVNDLDEGADKLNGGAAGIYDATGKLNTAMGELYTGVGSLNSGASELSKGLSSLKKGLKTLYSNTDTIKKAVGNLHIAVGTLKQGTDDLKSGTGEFASKTDGMGTQVSNEIEDITTSMTGKNIETVSFVSKQNTNIKSVQFVIQTEGVEIYPPDEVETTESEKLSFWQKFLKLFD